MEIKVSSAVSGMLILFATWQGLCAWQRAKYRIVYPPGALSAPVETHPTKLWYKFRTGTELKQRGEISGTVRLIAKKHYADVILPFDAISHWDIGIAWGSMADPETLERIRIEQYRADGRRLRWEIRATSGESGDPVKAREFSEWVKRLGREMLHCHLIITNALVEEEVDRIRVGQIIRFQGQLFDVKMPIPGGRPLEIATGLTGPGGHYGPLGEESCDIILLTQISEMRTTPNGSASLK